MKTWKIVLLCLSVVFLLVFLGVLVVGNDTQQRFIEKTIWTNTGNQEPNGGLIYVPVRQYQSQIGYYIIDTNFNLCFLKIDAGLVQVPCESLRLSNKP